MLALHFPSHTDGIGFAEPSRKSAFSNDDE
jgi:hypothetical protein